jgi:hypothetical protein
MVILFAQNREQQVRTLDDQVASRATPRLRRTSSYFVLEAKSSTHWLSKDLTCHTETPSWHEFCRRQRGFSCSTGCWCFDLGIYAGNTGKAKAAHTHTLPSHHKKSNQKCYSKGVQGQGMSMDSMDTGHLVVDGVWTCLDIRWPQALGGNCRTTLLVAASGCAQHAATA